jgi:integrase/recombinase XerD
MALTDRTARDYSRYIARWQAAGSPDPEAWLDGLTPACAKVARQALRRHDPSLALRNRYAIDRAPRALTLAELDRVRLAAHTELVRQTIDALYYSAARVEELLRLQPEDVRGGVIYLPATKTGNIERPIPLHAEFPLEMLPHPYGISWALKHFHIVGERAGVLPFYPRLMRPTAATHMLAAGVPISVVQEILGHKSLEITRRYLAVSSEAKRDAISALG